jgi:hypothetical protein
MAAVELVDPRQMVEVELVVRQRMAAVGLGAHPLMVVVEPAKSY